VNCFRFRKVLFFFEGRYYFDDVKCVLVAQHGDQLFVVRKSGRKSENEIVMLIADFEGVYLYNIYLNEPHNVIINKCHLTFFAFSYIYFSNIAIIVTMWTVFLWLSLAISGLLL
jgi:hypothetical protein